jgi:uncharacterized CHY-type Zn-finger protein
VTVHGAEVDAQFRCAHWHGPQDIVAIKFPCCGRYYACAECHTALAGHAAERWPVDEFEQYAILCGACGAELTIAEYLACEAHCPRCTAEFNPRCALHHERYFHLP